MKAITAQQENHKANNAPQAIVSASNDAIERR
jgi:hypothetical protein